MSITRRLITCFALFFVFLRLSAHEGMWIPSLLARLNESDMVTMGLKLTAEDIYSINKSSIKDAIVQFGGGCTGEIISSEGLLLTNHHCGYGQIQSHSSLENDYLKNGFWAYDRSQELKNPGLTATFIVYIENVTNQVLDGTVGTPATKNQIIARNISRIIESATKNTKYEAVIKPFFYGNEYYMIVTKTYKDVRLVGAPPSSIGKFGGDTDNWAWPRHTGDFSLFRIYADAQNQPAEISDNNKPLSPAHSLPISIKGVKEGDFAMVYGFPGRTQQYLHSASLQYTLDYGNPAKIAMRTASLAVIDEAMKRSDQLRIQYAAKQSRIANAWKKWQGESRGLQLMNAVARKQDFEREFSQRALKADKSSYADGVKELGELIDDNTQLQLAYDYFVELIYFGPEMFRFANRFDKLLSQYGNLPQSDMNRMASDLLPAVQAFYKDFNAQVDREVARSLIKMFVKGIKSDYLGPQLTEYAAKTEVEQNQWIDKLYSRTEFTNAALITGILKSPNPTSLGRLKKDPMFVLMQEVFARFAFLSPDYNAFTKEVDQRMEVYLKGMMELFPEKKLWPDANGTIRLSYGKVEGSEPRDGLAYKHYTTLDGIMEKYIPSSDEFDVPIKLRDLYRTKDYGPYAVAGSVPVAFTASLHTTGGNSGSPIINADGHLVGLNFDRTWESTMSDLMFSPEMCRNIAMDTRYLLFIIDKYAGAQNIMAEIKVVR